MSVAHLSAASLDVVRGAIGRAAARTGVDFQYLLSQAKSESGLDPSAQASGSSAKGLFQFLDQSWLGVVKQHGAEHGLGWAADAIQRRAGGGYTVSDPAMRRAVMALREQPEPAALMAAAYASDNAGTLSSTLGRQVGATDLYFAHFLGSDGASRFLKATDANPDTSAAALFPREARANRAIFYTRTGEARSLGQIYQLMGRKLDQAGDALGGGMQMAAAARPGDLVATPPGSGSNGATRLAYADSALADPDEQDTATMLAMLQQPRADMLKPTPEQAKLAYLVLSSTTLT